MLLIEKVLINYEMYLLEGGESRIEETEIDSSLGSSLGMKPWKLN